MVNFPEHNRISTVGGMNIEMVNILTGKNKEGDRIEICIYFYSINVRRICFCSKRGDCTSRILEDGRICSE